VDVFGNSATDIGAVLKGDADNNAQGHGRPGGLVHPHLLFGQGGQGEDLIARDVWRADDHGIGTYNQVRVAFGLAPLTDTGVSGPGEPFRFHGFELISSDPAVVQKLILAYTGPTRETFLANGKFAGDINPLHRRPGEDQRAPAPTWVRCSRRSSATSSRRLSTGDQFFYLNESFKRGGMQADPQFRATRCGQVIAANTSATNLQSVTVFRFLSGGRQAKGYLRPNKNGQGPN